MATGIKPPIIKTAWAAWTDAFRAIAAMPSIAAIAFAIAFGIGLPSLWLISDPIASTNTTWLKLISLITSIVQAFLLAPLAIVVHRYVILGEVAAGYSIDPSSRRYFRFVGFTILINLIADVQTLLPNIQGVTGIIANIALFVAVTVIFARTVILFPAIAVDAAGISLNNALRDTQGNFWRIVLIFGCLSMPILVLIVPLLLLLLRPPIIGYGELIVSMFFAVIQIPLLCAIVAAASHLFMALADDLARPGRRA